MKKTKKNQAGVGGIACIVTVLLIAISIQIVNLYRKNVEYAQKEAELNAVYQEETERRDELSDYEEYIGSKEYIENTARNK